MNKSYCPISGASQPKEPVRLIDANALKKRAVKVMFRDTSEIGEFYAVGTDDIDIMPTIDPDALRPTAYWIKCDLVEVEHGECTRYRDAGIKCSKCKHAYDKFALWDRTFCPGCGSRMIDCKDGERK